MANVQTIKKFEEEFKENLILNKGNNLIIKGADSIDKANYEFDLSNLISCSENYYEDLIKIHSNSEKVIELNKNTKLDLSGNGILYILVKSDLQLELNFNSKDFSALFIKLLIEDNIKLKLIENSNSKNLYKNLVLIQSKNSIVDNFQFIYNSKINFTESKLNQNAIYNLKSAYYIKNNYSYIKNISKHIKENSKSDMLIQGAADKNSIVICDGLIRIEKDAKNSKGIQNIKNIILDSTSKILSEPILEIENNQVVCSHGCSISKISEDTLFYLNSRGIDNFSSKNLIIDSFFNRGL